MSIGSLFSGIGGLELGLERAGVGRVVWQVEIDPFCQSVLAKHWPHVTRFHDVRSVGASTLTPVDVLCGGFPCQDISLAGKGAGLDGERSGLWHEYARIIGELRPRFVVIENVPGLLRRGLDVVIARLDELGYAVEGTRLGAFDVGAPHKRERLFLIAYAERVELRQQSRRSCGPRRQGAALAAIDGVTGVVAHADREGQLQQGWPISAERGRPVDRSGEDWGVWPPEPSICRVAHGLPHRLDRLKALGNAVVPQCAEIVGRRLLQIAGNP